MTMSSETANRYFQGKENVAIAIARRRIKAGLVLNGVWVGRAYRWRRDEVRQWLALGMPTAADFERREKASR